MRALIIVEKGFQDEEFIYPFYRFQEAGWDVDVWTPSGGIVYGKYGIPAKPNTSVVFKPADALVIPGGFESPDRLRMRQDVQQAVRTQDLEGRLIAAICHGPWVLVSAGICKGRRMTGYDSIVPDLINAGADYVEEPVVSDRNLVTAKHYRDNGAFMKAVLAWKPWPTVETHAI